MSDLEILLAELEAEALDQLAWEEQMADGISAQGESFARGKLSAVQTIQRFLSSNNNGDGI